MGIFLKVIQKDKPSRAKFDEDELEMEQEIEMQDDGIYQSGENNIIALTNNSEFGSFFITAQSDRNSPVSKGSKQIYREQKEENIFTSSGKF